MSDERPRLSVVALVHDDKGQILMGRRRRGAAQGRLVMPGGGVELGESLARALRREVYEETGLKVMIKDPDQPLDVAEMPGKKAHRICLIYSATVERGLPEDTDELYDVWFYNTDIRSTRELMQDWVRASLKRIGIIL